MMMIEFEPIRSQRFDIGRTINPFKCDCEKCDFMHCPKNNYAVKMRRKTPKLDEFWAIWGDAIVKTNKISKLMFNFKNQNKLVLSYDMINDMMECISFPKGLYWSPCGHYNEGYNRIDLVKFNRSYQEVVLGSVYIDKGNIYDSNMTDAQYKVAEKISNFIKNIIEKIFEHYEDTYKDSLVGWISPSGRYYMCDITQHSNLARMIGTPDLELEKSGWVKTFTNDDWYCRRGKPTAEQRNWLSIHGYNID